MATTQNHSKEFFDLVRSIGETKSKQEEDKICVREIATLKTHVGNSKVTLRQMKEFIVRMLYCEMLGHDASFGYIHAIKLTSSKNILEKRVGYLAVTLCLPKNHELILLTIANLQKDLKSTKYLETAAALSSATKIVNEETIPTLLPLVIELRKHAFALVRKKVIMLFHTFQTIQPGSVPSILDYAKEALCDRDPSVMASSLHIFEELVKDFDMKQAMKELTPSFVNILKQIIEHRLPRDYDYHRLPAPWVQIKILKILAVLGRDDKQTSDQMYDVLREVMQRADTGLNIGHAVVFESIKTITSIYQNNMLLENAASAISRFVTSSNHNLKYLGIDALSSIVKINPKYATQHQMAVIDCLEDPDETLKRITLSLLFTMTNPSNVVVIVKKLIHFTKKAVEDHVRSELVKQICFLAERFAPDPMWYIDTMNTMFEIGPQFMPQSAIQNILTVIAEGTGEDEQKDVELRIYCVDSFTELLEQKATNLHDLHVQMMAWVLGEYGYLSEKYSSQDITLRLCDLCDRPWLQDEDTRCYILSAVMKLVAQSPELSQQCPEAVHEVIEKYKDSKNVDLQQRCYEFMNLFKYDSDTMIRVLPVDGSCEEVEVDEELSFLDDYVEQARMMGSRDYVEEANRREFFERTADKKSEIKFQAYDKPQIGSASAFGARSSAAAVAVAPFSLDTPNNNNMVPSAMNPAFQLNTNSVVSTTASSVTADPTQPVNFYPNSMTNLGGLDSRLFQGKKQYWFEDDDKPAPQPQISQMPQQEQANMYTAPDQTMQPQQPISTPWSANSTIDSTASQQPLYPQSKQDAPAKPVSKKAKKLVNDMFKATGDGSKSSARRTKKTSSTSSLTAAKKSTSLQDQPSLLGESDMLSMTSATTQPPASVQQQTPPSKTMYQQIKTPQQQQAPAPVKNSDPLFEFLDEPVVEQQPPQRTQQPPKKAAVQDIMSMMDNPFGAPTSTQPSPINTSTKTSQQVSTPQQSVMMPKTLTPSTPTSTTSSTSSTAPVATSIASFKPGQLLNSYLEQYPRANKSSILLFKDTYISLNYFKFYKDDCIALAFNLATERGFTLTSVNCQFQPPDKFALDLETDYPTSMTTVRNNAISFAKLEPGNPITFVTQLRLQSAVGFGNSFMATIGYADDQKRSRFTPVSLNIDPMDTFRAQPLMTADFSKMWQQQLTHQKSIQIKAGLYTEEMLKQKLINVLRLNVVSVIDKEVIASGRVPYVTTSNVVESAIFLVHVSVQKDPMVWTVKSKDVSLSEMVCRVATKALMATQSQQMQL